MAPSQDSRPIAPSKMVFDIETIGELYYRFTTDGGSVYEVVFFHQPNDTGVPLYVFNIDRVVRSTHSDHDANAVRDTVAEIVKAFFEDVDNAIITTCDNVDGKQNGRKRLFDRWYNSLNDGSIQMLSTHVVETEYDTWASMYYHKDNMFKTILERLFSDMY